MENPKLKIAPRKYGGESTVVSLRLPRDMIQAIDDVASSTGRTRSEIMSMGLEFALNNMEIEPTQQKGK